MFSIPGADSRKGVPGVKFSKIRVLGDIHDKCAPISVNSYVTIIYLPLISHFISIMQTLLGSSDL